MIAKKNSANIQKRMNEENSYSRPSIIQASVIRTLDYLVSIISLMLKVEKTLADTIATVVITYSPSVFEWFTTFNVGFTGIRRDLLLRLSQNVLKTTVYSELIFYL